MAFTFAADKIHFPPNLFKIVQGIGIFCKNFIAIILQTQMSQVNEPGSCGPADPLFNGFGRVAKTAAQIIQC